MDIQSPVKTVDDLSFTSRDSVGRINWFDIDSPKTEYWHVHYNYGCFLANELVSFMKDEDSDFDGSQIGFILGAVGRDRSINDGIQFGFFEVIGDVLGKATI